MFRKFFIPSNMLMLIAASNLYAGPADASADSRAATYQIHHALIVKDIPAGAQFVRIWFWLPDDDDCQKVLDLSVVKAPKDYRITRDFAHGHRYLYAELCKPTSSTQCLATDFVIRRQATAIPLDPDKAGVLNDTHRKAFAEYLRRDCPNMEVTDRMVELASNLCGDDQNVVTQARKLFNFVVENTNHYSIPNAPKSSGKGSVEYCLDQKGGGCTDQHALFIALARARGIPTRLHFGSRLPAKNEGKEIDPGYRCWVTYFVPNYGWVPMDISAANTTPTERDRFFSGLDERRLRFSEGRDLELNPRQQGPRVNLFITAYIEVDGKPHTAFERVLRFVELHEAKR
jgi:transglutaminase-like putative cysteine protease